MPRARVGASSCSSSVKQCTFAVLFGWWQPRQLLELEDRLGDVPEDVFLEPDVLLAAAAAQAADTDSRIVALFASDQSDSDDDARV